MRVGRLLYPIRELGPGNRIGLWVQGCLKSCPGCANPELQEINEKKSIPIEILSMMVVSAIEANDLVGITISGGEPFLQAMELNRLLGIVRQHCDDVLVFTGFKYEELLKRDDPIIKELLSKISVLVDGEYIEELNKGERLRGSSNQNILFLDETKKPLYEEYINSSNRFVDSFVSDDGVISVGIHPKDFISDVAKSLKSE